MDAKDRGTPASLEIATKLFELRDDVRRVLGPIYPERVEPFRKMLRDLVAHNGWSLIVAAQTLAQMADTNARSPLTVGLVMSAYLDEVEATP